MDELAKLIDQNYRMGWLDQAMKLASQFSYEPKSTKRAAPPPRQESPERERPLCSDCGEPFDRMGGWKRLRCPSCRLIRRDAQMAKASEKFAEKEERQQPLPQAIHTRPLRSFTESDELRSRLKEQREAWRSAS